MEHLQNENQRDSLFLSKLPAELRNRVYELVLVHRREIKVNSRQRLRDHRAILQTCKKIRQEASKIYYTRNAFRIILPMRSKPRRQTMFFKSAEFEASQHVTKLSINFHPSEKQRKLWSRWSYAELIERRMATRALIRRNLAQRGLDPSQCRDGIIPLDGYNPDSATKLKRLRSNIESFGDGAREDLRAAGISLDFVHVILPSNDVPVDRAARQDWACAVWCGMAFQDSLKSSEMSSNGTPQGPLNSDDK